MGHKRVWNSIAWWKKKSNNEFDDDDDDGEDESSSSESGSSFLRKVRTLPGKVSRQQRHTMHPELTSCLSAITIDTNSLLPCELKSMSLPRGFPPPDGENRNIKGKLGTIAFLFV
ncbi:hypothetical protein PV325_002534 [Microctonus aethiopoides]|nr:hypothetical protein PV325_002534 [Microctonus aethiopoides]